MDGRDWLLLLAVVGVFLLAGLAVAIVLLIRLIRLSGQIWTPDMPTKGKVAFAAAALYTVSPLDLLPDPIYLDDIGVLLATVAYLGKLIQQKRAERGVPPATPPLPSLPADPP